MRWTVLCTLLITTVVIFVGVLAGIPIAASGSTGNHVQSNSITTSHITNTSNDLSKFNITIEWNKTIGTNASGIIINQIHETEYGYVGIGNIAGTGNQDPSDGVIADLSSEGDLQEVRTIGGPNTDVFGESAVTAHDNIIIAATLRGEDSHEDPTTVLKLEEYGDVIWKKQFASGQIADVAANGRRGALVLVTADTEENNTAFVYNLNQTGDVVWRRQLPGNHQNYRHGEINNVGDGDYLITINFISNEAVRASRNKSLYYPVDGLSLVQIGVNGNIAWSTSHTINISKYDSLNNRPLPVKPKAIPVDGDGYMIIGGSAGPDRSTPVVYRVSGTGRKIWNKTYEHPFPDRYTWNNDSTPIPSYWRVSVSDSERENGGLLMGGWVQFALRQRAGYWLMQINSTGGVVFQRVTMIPDFHERDINFIKFINRSNYLVGYSTVADHPEHNIENTHKEVIRYERGSGAFVSNKTVIGPSHDQGFAVAKSPRGGIVVGGRTQTFGRRNPDENYDGVVAEVTQRGYGRLLETIEDNQSARVSQILRSENGGYFLIGTSRREEEYRYSQVWIGKVTGAGQLQWRTRYRIGDEVYLVDAVRTETGDIVLAGGKRQYSDLNTGWVLRVNSDGRLAWNRTFPSQPADLIETQENGVILVGTTNAFGQRDDLDGWALRLNQHGVPLWKQSYGSGGNDGFSKIYNTTEGYRVFGRFSRYDPEEQEYSYYRSLWSVHLDDQGRVLNKTKANIEIDDTIAIEKLHVNRYLLLKETSGSYGDHDENNEFNYTVSIVDRHGSHVRSENLRGVSNTSISDITVINRSVYVVGTRTRSEFDSDIRVSKFQLHPQATALTTSPRATDPTPQSSATRAPTDPTPRSSVTRTPTESPGEGPFDDRAQLLVVLVLVALVGLIILRNLPRSDL